MCGITCRSLIGLVCIFTVASCGDDDKSTKPVNHAPTILSLTAHPEEVPVTGVTTVTCHAVDADGDELSYSWSASGGAVTEMDNCAEWRAPETPGVFEISLVVTDEYNNSDSGSLAITTYINSSDRILIDASRDGGTWWLGYPNHQGKKLANHLRQRGYEVEELEQGADVTDSILNRYDNIIVANCSHHSSSEFGPYDRFLERNGTSLIITSEKLRPGEHDAFSERYGLNLTGISRGLSGFHCFVSKFANHEITAGIDSFEYKVGSALLDPSANPDIEVLGWLSDGCYIDLNDNGIKDVDEPIGAAVMGILHHPTSKIFFIGDINTLQPVPQPFIDNLIDWAFGE